MPKYKESLSIREIKKINKPGIFAIGHVKGLSVRISTSGGATYVFRYRLLSHSRAVTLGSVDLMSLKDAISLAMKNRILINENKDPYLEHLKEKERLKKEIEENIKKLSPEPDENAFYILAAKFIEYRRQNGYFANNNKAEQTQTAMLVNHAYPVIKNKTISSITPEDIRNILSKVWRDSPSLSTKLLNILKQVFEWALAMKYYSGANPASMDGPLKTLMEPFNTGRAEGGHYASLDYREVPELMLELWQLDTMASKAFMFSILTASRSKPVRNATWSQVSLANKFWEIPIENDKSKKAQRLRTLMLSAQAVKLLKTIPRKTDLIFYSPRMRPFCDVIFGKIIRDLNYIHSTKGQPPFVDKNIIDKDGKPTPITQHGTARASFKTWAKCDVLRNNHKFVEEAVEMCLLHERKDPLKGAYDRSKLETERRKVMEAWGKYCCSKIPELN